MSQNLIPGGHGRRTIYNYVKEYLTPDKIFDKITQRDWPYKRNVDFYVTRDNALCCVAYMSSGRINEIVKRLKRSHFVEKSQYIKTSDPDAMFISNFWVSKRWPGGMRRRRIPILDENDKIVSYKIIEEYRPPTRNPIIEIPLPRVGVLGQYTEKIEEYLELLHQDQVLFPFTTSRAWSIIRYKTDEFPHWLREQSLNYMVNTIRGGPFAVKKLRGIEDIRTLMHYYRGDQESATEDLKRSEI